MNFTIEQDPPSAGLLEQERKLLESEVKRLSMRDTIVTFIIISVCSLALGLIVFWQTGNLHYTSMAVAVFPILGTILSLLGITKSTGFRSAANSIAELQNELARLSPISNTSWKDVDTLAARHKLVGAYNKKVLEQDRETVNAELAMYWEFDSSTMANTARGRDLIKKARGKVDS